MRTPDIQLAPGDTQPAYEFVLYEPDTAAGRRGDPRDLFGCTVTFEFQLRGSTTVETREALVLASTAAPATNQGAVLIDWLSSGGAVATGNQTALNYDARFIIVDPTGHQETYPNGPDVILPDGSNPAFLWMQVSRDFRAP